MELADAADDAETRWTNLLLLAELSGDAATIINENAGHWQATSDLWTDLEVAHANLEETDA